MPGALDDLGVGLAEQLVRVGVLVVALLRMAAPDRRADRLDDDYLAPVPVLHADPASSASRLLAKRTRLTGRVNQTLRAESGSCSSESSGSGAIACGLARVAADHHDVVALGAQRGARPSAPRPTSSDAPRGHRPRRARRAATSSSRRSPRTREVKSELLGRLGELLPARGRCSPPPPRRCRSRSSPRRAGGPTASPPCTCSTRSRRWSWSSSPSRPRRPSDTRARFRDALRARSSKTAVEVPDAAGFVVNRLLFPYLFDAVRLLERDGARRRRRSTPA